MKKSLNRWKNRIVVVGLLTAMLFSFGACRKKSGFSLDDFKPKEPVTEQKVYSFTEETPSETVVYDGEKLTEFRTDMREYPVEYGYEELFDYEKAMEGVTADHSVTSHAYSALDENGQLTKEHLYEIVKSNNEIYLEDATAVIRKLEDDIVLQICGIVTDVVNDMLEKYPKIDKERVYCNLGYLKVVEKASALNYGAVQPDMVLHITRGTAALLDNSASENMYKVLVHESMHMLQFGCVCERQDGCVRRCGIAHAHGEAGQDYSDWVWMGEGSAERMTSLYTGTAPMTYYNYINYILTLDLATMLREDIPANYMESIYFYDDVENLFWAFDAKSEEEKREIYQLMYSLEIMQEEPEDVKQAYYDIYGIEWTEEVSGEVFNKVKRPILKTVTKQFYTNLADAIVRQEVSKNDVLFLVNLYESTMNQHLHFDNKDYNGYNAEFVEWYKACRADFFASFENLTLEEYAGYIAGDGESTVNATMKWLPTAKKEFLAEKYEAHQCKYKMQQ